MNKKFLALTLLMSVSLIQAGDVDKLSATLPKCFEVLQQFPGSPELDKLPELSSVADREVLPLAKVKAELACDPTESNLKAEALAFAAQKKEVRARNKQARQKTRVSKQRYGNGRQERGGVGASNRKPSKTHWSRTQD